MGTHLDTPVQTQGTHHTKMCVFLVGRTVGSGQRSVSARPCNEHIVEGCGWRGWLHSVARVGGSVRILRTFLPALP